MDKKEEIESHIKFAKENREYFDNKIVEYEKELQELELTSFNRSIELQSMSVGFKGVTTPDKEFRSLEFTGHIKNSFGSESILNQIDATLSMIDLADWCNTKFETKKDFGFPYYIVMEKDDESLEFNFKNTDYRLSFVKFNSKQSVELAISEINKSPELTKLAKIFLGVTK